MAAVFPQVLPLDLNITPLGGDETHREAHPALLKETSTVGDLISFTERGPRHESPAKRRRQRRRSGSDLEAVSDRSNSVRRRSLQRSISVKALRSGRLSQSPSLTPPTAWQTARGSPYSQNDGQETRRRRKSRRDSMLEALRDDLERIPCLQALKRHTVPPAVTGGLKDDDANVFSDSDTEVGYSSPTRRRLSYMAYRRGSHLSGSSRESFSVSLTENELRKIKMLQTLNKMDGHATQSPRKVSIDSEMGERAVLEASYIKGAKRASISTHVLMKARTRRASGVDANNKAKSKPRPLVVNDDTGPAKRTEAEMCSDAQKERSQKIFQMLKKSEKPKLVGLGGKDKDGSSAEDTAKDSILSFRKRLRRKKMKPLQVWRKRAKFVILLLRAWKIHSNNINEAFVDNNASLDMITRGDQLDLMFDITTYKASKEAMISQEVKRILMKNPKLRTEDEQYYVQIFLRNYKSIAEYPVKMQKLIAQRSWIESFDIKRVIVREGHVPMCFYFILSGSAIVSAMEDGAPKTVMFLNRGDSFGDLAILNNARRETTVISREKIELLVMTDTDFVDIFMSGGIRDPEDPFLKSISFLEGWPREKLIDNPKKCIFSYFKRGTILVKDTNNSDWIFVIKSGSASVLKRLHAVDVKKHKRQKKLMDFRDEVLTVLHNESYLSHEEQVQLMAEEEKRSLDDQNLHVRFYALPEINVKTNDSYNELRQMKEEYINANSMNRALGALEKLADAGVDVKSETGNSGFTNASSIASKKVASMRRKSLVNSKLKGPFIKSTSGLGREQSFASMSSQNGMVASRGETASGKSRRSSFSKGKVVSISEPVRSDFVDHVKKVDDWQEMSLPSLAASPLNDLTIKPQEKQPIFVEIQALTKGAVFGIAEMLFENQPNFSLVSNGAECVMIEKKFFMEHASQGQMVALKEATYPYPSNDALQGNLESHFRWDRQKKLTLNTLIHDVKRARCDPNDARAMLSLPAITA